MAAIAAMANFPGMNEQQTGAITDWVKAQIEAQIELRFTMASRAIAFIRR